MSRYSTSKQLERRDANGRRVRYLAPRILPIEDTTAAAGTTVGADEVNRLDLIANRTLGDPLQAWRIADANQAIDPFELCDHAGQTLKLPGASL